MKTAVAAFFLTVIVILMICTGAAILGWAMR